MSVDCTCLKEGSLRCKFPPMIDLSTIPDSVIFAEAARRMAARPGSGRQKILKPCPRCGVILGARELRAHRSTCKLPAPDTDQSSSV